MHVGPRVRLFIQVGVAAIYLIALLLFRQVSISHWFIMTGFHVAVLMLVPYRYWPALFIGETARLAYVSVTCLDQFGPVWAALNVIPSLTFEAPVVWLFRERLHLLPTKNHANMWALVLCTLIVAIVASGETLGQLQVTPLPPGYVIHYGELSARLVLGNFMGVLTIAPIALVWAMSFAEANRHWRTWFHGLAESRLLIESGLVVFPVLGFLVWVGRGEGHARDVAQMAMFLPVIAMALRHGWRGAAVTGTLASFSILALMPAQNDHGTLLAETVLAMAMSTMLLTGARITMLDRRAEKERFDSHLAMAMAQRNLTLGEAQMRVTAQALDQLRDSIQSVFNLMLGRLRHLQPVVDDAGYRRQSQNAQEQIFRLTDSLNPSMLRERGLEGALVHGVLARALNEARVKYWCDVRGPLSHFPHAMSLATYRIVCEAITEACADRDLAQVLVKIRCGRGRRPWIVAMIETRRHPVRAAHVDWEPLMQQLRVATTGMGRRAIEDRSAAFEGTVRERALRQGHRLIVSLLQPQPQPNHPHTLM